ncbi:hypothetical protein Dimus_012754, partial [Dionaea muscipula]
MQAFNLQQPAEAHKWPTNSNRLAGNCKNSISAANAAHHHKSARQLKAHIKQRLAVPMRHSSNIHAAAASQREFLKA